MNIKARYSSHTSKQHDTVTQALGGHICSTEHKSCNGRSPEFRSGIEVSICTTVSPARVMVLHCVVVSPQIQV